MAGVEQGETETLAPASPAPLAQAVDTSEHLRRTASALAGREVSPYEDCEAIVREHRQAMMGGVEQESVILFLVGVLARIRRADSLHDAQTFAEAGENRLAMWRGGGWSPGPHDDPSNWPKEWRPRRLPVRAAAGEVAGYREPVALGPGGPIFAPAPRLLGRCVQRSYGSDVVILEHAPAADNFHEGLEVFASPNADGSEPRHGTARVVSVDRPAGTVALAGVDGITGFIDGDYLFAKAPTLAALLHASVGMPPDEWRALVERFYPDGKLPGSGPPSGEVLRLENALASASAEIARLKAEIEQAHAVLDEALKTSESDRPPLPKRISALAFEFAARPALAESAAFETFRAAARAAHDAQIAAKATGAAYAEAIKALSEAVVQGASGGTVER